MILLLIDKIKNLNNRDFIPLLKAWRRLIIKKIKNNSSGGYRLSEHLVF